MCGCQLTQSWNHLSSSIVVDSHLICGNQRGSQSGSGRRKNQKSHKHNTGGWRIWDQIITVNPPRPVPQSRKTSYRNDSRHNLFLIIVAVGWIHWSKLLNVDIKIAPTSHEFHIFYFRLVGRGVGIIILISLFDDELQRDREIKSGEIIIVIKGID